MFWFLQITQWYAHSVICSDCWFLELQIYNYIINTVLWIKYRTLYNIDTPLVHGSISYNYDKVFTLCQETIDLKFLENN